jgi:hypothetical protein
MCGRLLTGLHASTGITLARYGRAHDPVLVVACLFSGWDPLAAAKSELAAGPRRRPS